MIKINNHKLPKNLEKLILDGRWKEPEDLTQLKKIEPLKDIEYVDFLNPDSMEIETAELKNDYLTGDSELFGITTIKDFGTKEVEGYLPFELIVLIAASPGDDYICLFYSDENNPEVYVSDWSKNKCRWKMIANTFGDFQKKFKI